MDRPQNAKLRTLDLSQPIWDRFFTVSPLVIIGTRDDDGGYDLAPKHMAMPFGWGNYYGFMCTPSHRTYVNAKRENAFTVSFPHPEQVVMTSLAAAPRCEDGTKPSVEALPTIEATVIDGVLLSDAYLYLECRVDRIIDGFGRNSLLVGEIVAARLDERALRTGERDDQDILTRVPLLGYLPPGRYATIDRTFSFPFHAGYVR